MKRLIISLLLVSGLSATEAQAQTVDPCSECCLACCGAYSYASPSAILRLFRKPSANVVPKAESTLSDIVDAGAKNKRKLPTLKMPF